MIQKSIAVLVLVAQLVGFYPRTMVVTYVDYDNDLVCMMDSVGYYWEMTGSEDWMEGDVVSCIMHDNGTEHHLDDDIIVKAYYSGWNTDEVDEIRYSYLSEYAGNLESISR